MKTQMKSEFGDWQTPHALVSQIIWRLSEDSIPDPPVYPRTVIEPTCGIGTFLYEAQKKWPDAKLVGRDINSQYIRGIDIAADIKQGDFFQTDWNSMIANAEEPILIIGNPPWVTNAEQGKVGSRNIPQKSSSKLVGLDALTGKSNFDISENIICSLVDAVNTRNAVISMICKFSVARKVLEYINRKYTNSRVCCSLFSVDARKWFGVEVRAVILNIHFNPSEQKKFTTVPIYKVFSDIFQSVPYKHIGIVAGRMINDLDAFTSYSHIGRGSNPPSWRSGIKHDCADIMNLPINQVDKLEPDYLYPLLRGTDIMKNRWPPENYMIVTQTKIGQDTTGIKDIAPKTWEYLKMNEQRLFARKSSIYKNKPPFSIFGVGPYTFKPWKVAIAGFDKSLEFVLIGPYEDKPVVFDDTIYFLSFDDEATARETFENLKKPEVILFLNSQIFWMDKRPITKKILQSVDLDRINRI